MTEGRWSVRLATACTIAAVTIPALAISPDWMRPEATKAALCLLFAGIAVLCGSAQVRLAFARFATWQKLVLFLPLFIAMLSGWAAERPWPALALCFQGAAYLGLCLFVTSAPRHLREIALHGIVATGSIVALIGLLERAGFALGIASTSLPTEPVTTFGNVAFASEFVLPSAFLCLRSAVRSRHRLLGLGFTALHLVHVLYLATADTLTAAVAYQCIAVLGLVVLYLRDRAQARALAPALIAGLACFHLPLAATLPPTDANNASANAAASAPKLARPEDFRTLDVRLHTWRAVLHEVVPAAPWLGLGAGSFDEMYPPYRSAEERALSLRSEGSTVVNTAHNDALQALAETGVLGLASLIAAGLVLVMATRRGSANERLWMQAALLAVLINGCARTPLLANAPVAALFAVVLGALLARGGRSMHQSAARAEWVPLFALAMITSGGALYGASRCAATFIASEALAALPPPGVAPDPTLRDKLAETLDRALRFAPDDYRMRLVRARLSGDGTRALEEVEAVLRDAPYDLQAWALDAQLSLLAASMIADPLPALRRCRNSNAQILKIEPENPRARANLLLCEVHLARAQGEFALAFERYRDLVALEPALRKELEPTLFELRANAAQDAINARRFEEAAQWLAEDAAQRRNDDLLLDHIERLTESGVVSGARILAEVAHPGFDRQERYDRLSQRLSERALDAWNQGQGPAMKEALAAAVALAVDRSEFELNLGREWMKRSLSAPDGEPKRLALFYGRKLTIDGHESAFLSAVLHRDPTSAEAAMKRLERYTEYAELPIVPVDRAVLQFLRGDRAQAEQLIVDAKQAGLRNLGERRSLLYAVLFENDPALREAIADLVR